MLIGVNPVSVTKLLCISDKGSCGKKAMISSANRSTRWTWRRQRVTDAARRSQTDQRAVDRFQACARRVVTSRYRKNRFVRCDSVCEDRPVPAARHPDAAEMDVDAVR